MKFNSSLSAVATIAFGLSVGLATIKAQNAPSGPPPVPSPRQIVAPGLDAKVVESREKVTDQQWRAGYADHANAKNPSAAWLDQQIGNGDLHAAILKADDDRKSPNLAVAPTDTAALASLAAKGTTAGDATAFLAKADIDWNRGDFDNAVKDTLAASSRGSTAAAYKLARFAALKTQKNAWPGVTESPMALLYRAADKGDPDAAREYGLALDRGYWQIDSTHSLKFTQAPDQAVAWMERASLLGSSEANLWLGLHYMKQATGLVDPARLKALEYLQTARHTSADLKEPASGKTFAELEAAGAFEPGLLGEIKRRETKEQTDRAAKPPPHGNAAPIGVASKKEIDHEVLPIVGDPNGAKPVYNLVGLSPYKEFAQEGAVKSVAGTQLVVDQLPSLADPRGWRVDLVSAGKLLFSVQVQTTDATKNSVGLARPLPPNLPPKLRFRLVRYHSFFSTFGLDNSAGLKPGLDASSADEVITYDSGTQLRRQYFFHSDLLVWVDSSSGQRLSADFDLAPGSAVIVKRTESSAVSLQARGMVAEQPFDATPPSGVSLLSLRKNNFGINTAGDPTTKNLVAASDLPVISIKKDRWSLGRNVPQTDWWTTLGLGATAQFNVVMGSAAVLVNK